MASFLPKKKVINTFYKSFSMYNLNCKKFLLTTILLILISFSSFAQIESEIFLKGATVTGIVEEEGFLWVATYGQGIYRYSYEDEKWINFSTKSGNLDNDLFYNIAVSKNFVWAGASEGLFIYTKKRDRWSKRKFALGGQFGNWIRSLKYDPDQNVLWIGRFRNITRLDVKRRRYNDISRIQGKDQKSNNIKAIELDGDSLVWFGTESGVHIYNKKKKYTNKSAWRYITNKKRAFNEEGDAVSVSNFLFESDKIWFATDEFVTKEQPNFNVGGIYIFDRKINWERISRGDGLAANGIYSLGKTGNHIWVGVYEFDQIEKAEYGKGLFIINRLTGRVSPVDLNQIKIVSSTILSFHFDGKYMWIGTGEGLVRVKIDNPLAEWSTGN
jgi:ligand-binding sensor domain-containing protein